MYLSVDPDRSLPVVLAEGDDFTSFKVVTATRSWGELGRTLGDAGRVDPPHVWVHAAAVRALGTPGDPDWAAGFAAMVEYAGTKGWLDESGAIRAHCDWPLGEPGPA